MSVNLQNKIIFASVPRTQLQVNLKQYTCQLTIQENLQTLASKKYLTFKHIQGKQPPFKIVLSKFKRPSSLMHVYKLQNEKFALKGRIQRIAQSRVEKKAKQIQVKQVDFDDQDQYVQKKLVFQKQQSSEYDSSDNEYSSQSSSQGVAPSSQQAKSRIKNAIIEILNRKKISSVKDLNQQLKKNYKIKIPESSAKQIAHKVCITDKKTKGFVLREAFIDQEERMEGKKKVKPDNY